MKLDIPKPVVEVDSAHADPVVVHEEFQGRNPDYTNEGTYPIMGPAESENVSDSEIRRLIVDDCRSAGLVSGAVVVHTRLPIQHRINPLNWGLVIRPNHPSVVDAKWKPLCVRWISGSFEDCTQADLCLLMPAPEKYILQARASRDTTPNQQ